jgi:large subunit ribosomal protein L13
VENSSRITRSLRKEDVQRDWWIVDAAGQTVGRLASKIAILLRGKHKPWFTPHVDNGDFVVVINADKIEIQGKRVEKKEYSSHSMYPGARKVKTFKEVKAKNPAFIVEHAVKGMIPKNRLGRKIIKKLKVYNGEDHPHTAQQPQVFE